MKSSSLSKRIFVLLLMFSPVTWSANFVYSTLVMKNYEEMALEVKNRVNEAETLAAEDIVAAKNKLREALQLVLSRPNSDNIVSLLIVQLRTPLRNIDAYESSVRTLVEEAIGNIKNEKSSGSSQATSLIVLENFMSEFKPDAKKNTAIRNIYIKIRDANLKVGSKLKSDLRMRGVTQSTHSPSELAKEILSSDKKQ